MEYYLEYILIAALVVCILYNLLPSKKEGYNSVNKPKHRFVNYYASWCSWSQQLFKLEDGTPGAWTQLKELKEDDRVKNLGVEIVDLECDKEGNEEKCQGIEAYPTIKLHKQGGETVEYGGERSLESFREFLITQLSN